MYRLKLKNKSAKHNRSLTSQLFSLPDVLSLSGIPDIAASFLGMVRIHSEIGKQERLSAWFLAAAVGFDGNEYGIDLL
jgi:hypothetical protein